MRQQVSESYSALEIALRDQVRVPYGDGSKLTEIGLDSLAIVRIVVAASPDSEQEIDVSSLAGVSTVGELRAWLAESAIGGETI